MRYTGDSWALLAVLRFALAFLVFDGHLCWAGLPSALQASIPIPIGRASVLGFLLISGASIAASYRSRPDGFYTRRFLRIYPLYFAAVVFTVLVAFLVGPSFTFPTLTLHQASSLTNLANLFLLQNAVAIPLPYNAPVWSLAVEVWLYALTPLFFRMPRRWLLGLAAASLFLFAFRGGEFLASWPVLGSLKWCWPWWIGFLAMRDQERMPALVAGGVAAGLFGCNAEMAHGWQGNALMLLVLGAVLWAGKVRLGRRLTKLFNFLGDVSYPIYLFHMPLIILLYGRLGIRSELGMTAVILVVAIALTVVYEERFTRIFWKPITLTLVNRLPSGWTLFRAGSNRKPAPAVLPEPALVP